MICPKCNGEQKGQLRVLKGLVSRDKKGNELCGLVCDNMPHFFSIATRTLDDPKDVAPEDINNEVDLDKAMENMPKEFHELEAHFPEGHSAFIRKFPTLEDYRDQY